MPPFDGPNATAIATLQKRIMSLSGQAPVFSSSAEIYRDLSSNSNEPSLDVRIEAAMKLAEKCASTRENIKLGEEFEELDIQATRLWNLSTTLTRVKEDGDSSLSSKGKDVLHVRLLAFFMLDCSHPSSTRKLQNTIRLFRVAVKAGKTCLDQQDVKWAWKTMERAAKYQEDLTKACDSPEFKPEDQQTRSRLSCDYFTLRTVLAWRQSNLSMADYMYSKAKEQQQSLLDPRMSENLIDALYEIGNELLQQSVFDAATKWLQRSFDVISEMDPISLSESGAELRLAVMHSLARAYLAHATEGSLDKARNVIDMMNEDWPTRLTVYLLRLDLVNAESPDNMQSYSEVLSRMLSIVELTEHSFKIIMGRIHVLVSKKDIRLACKCLDELLIKRILVLERDDWIERTFVTRLWVTIQDRAADDEAILPSLRNILDSMMKKLTKALSPKATHAAQILLWKITEAFFSQGKYQIAGSWCRIAQHSIFDTSGGSNIAKISRKIILCALESKDFGMAMEAFQEMPKAARNEVFTSFLMFKVAVRTSDKDLAVKCLQHLSESSDPDRRLLYGCALDAQETGNRELALVALRLVLDQIGLVAPDIGHIPTILRCAIRLTMAEIEGSREAEATIESLCLLLEKAAEQAKRSRQKPRTSDKHIEIVFTIKELDWFARNAYNIGLRGIVEWSSSRSYRIISACIRFLELYPDDIDEPTLAEVSYRRLLCNYLCACISIELARVEDNIEAQLQHYLVSRRHIQDFRSKNETVRSKIEQEAEDLSQKFGILLAYDFEAAARLKDWDTLRSIVEEAALSTDKGISIFEKVTDILISCEAPSRVKLIVMQVILNYTVPSPMADIVKLSRWIRTLVQLSIAKDPKVTEALLVEVIDVTKNRSDGQKYPNDEIQWLTGLHISPIVHVEH
ncbi:uncharacterized protein H6S33_000342 [Morchella sextelata]|uniref:uncharacterized protein n=1 Tax=Morchella sextelata TaxID=1174677 RepID=UPI001D045EE6|nr:uncharacterized protein H6S33_000342 [Morchella sextelata]KAH0614706.1 hypothetical protein H6S33_000342 [Morchella sextelata]